MCHVCKSNGNIPATFLNAKSIAKSIKGRSQFSLILLSSHQFNLKPGEISWPSNVWSFEKSHRENWIPYRWLRTNIDSNLNYWYLLMLIIYVNSDHQDTSNYQQQLKIIETCLLAIVILSERAKPSPTLPAVPVPRSHGPTVPRPASCAPRRAAIGHFKPPTNRWPQTFYEWSGSYSWYCNSWYC